MANIVVLRTLGLHPITRALHNICVTYMLTETHSGYDMPWDENYKNLENTWKTSTKYLPKTCLVWILIAIHQ